MSDDQATEVSVQALPVFPGYETLRELGSGGMAKVYLARDESLDRLVAIKVISAELNTPDFLARFAAEAKTAAQLKHANIVAVYASGEVAGRPYIAFEFVPGGTLEDRLRAGEVPGGEALEVALKVADALAYLHERGIIHRDVKPANILFGEDGKPLLSDFGIAKAVEANTGLTQVGVSIGSPAYMSPEQLRGGQVTPQSDIYGFGLVLAQLLLGGLPANAQDEKVLAAAGRHKSFLQRCLAATASERPSAAECSDHLAMLVQVERQPLGRWRTPIGLIVAALVCIGLALLLINPFATDFIDIKVIPENASVFVNGQSITVGAIELTAQPQKLAAIAVGFYGEYLALPAAGAAPLDLELQPLILPTADQFRVFQIVFEQEGARADPEAGTTGIRLYDELLKIKFDLMASRVNPQTISSGDLESVENLKQLANLGDAASAVAAFLLEYENMIEFESGIAEDWLRSASTSSGFALASYYRALAFRERKEDPQGGLDMQSLEQFRALMSLAAVQGLPMATEELRRIDQEFGRMPSRSESR